MRYRSHLRERYLLLLGYIGGISAIIGLLMLVPLLVIPFFPEEAGHAGSFLLAGVPLFGLGGLLWRISRPESAAQLTLQEGAVVVILIWAVAILAAAVPLMLTSQLTFSQAVFESTSGWTTTGLSVVDVTRAPRITLFFRSFIQLAGGAGFAIIALSAISGHFSAGLAGAEGRTDQLAPHVRQSANIVLRIYSGYAILGVLALRAVGMGWFDAINHSFTALATGGFSTRPESIGYWDSTPIEAVVIVLMLLGATNFAVAYVFLQGRVRVGLRSGELRSIAAVLIVSFILLVPFVTINLYPTAEKSVRVAVFEATSALTGTGFSTVGYHTWSPVGWLILIVLMSLGGGTGSTSGGIKQLRVYIIYKTITWEVRKAFLPRHALNEPAIWQGENRFLLSDQRVRQAATFVSAYFVVLIVGSGCMMVYGYSMEESLFEFASTLGTVGLSVGVTRPDLPVPLLWIQTVGMVLGRLEIFTVVVGTLKLMFDARSLFFRRA